MSLTKSPTVGGHIDANCTRCRMLTNHTIVALVAERPVRVQCNTCGGMHGYRAPKAAPQPRTSSPRIPSDKPKARTKSADQEHWSRALAERDASTARVYGMDETFRADELVRHPQFGLGLVTATFKPNKMEVLFEQGRKTLRCRL
ncbi:hypothetical protein [Geoalkalibacter sp.]|uniref:hypothetical protein n=1 Tax=Geoalkalibacter sp. TaxID=3041440 RepID=UPI00272E4936|nr:hypothetical protein [Geoalkalibacter sp.]